MEGVLRRDNRKFPQPYSDKEHSEDGERSQGVFRLTDSWVFDSSKSNTRKAPIQHVSKQDGFLNK
jgi:hypothetical protein